MSEAEPERGRRGYHGVPLATWNWLIYFFERALKSEVTKREQFCFTIWAKIYFAFFDIQRFQTAFSNIFVQKHAGVNILIHRQIPFVFSALNKNCAKKPCVKTLNFSLWKIFPWINLRSFFPEINIISNPG